MLYPVTELLVAGFHINLTEGGGPSGVNKNQFTCTKPLARESTFILIVCAPVGRVTVVPAAALTVVHCAAFNKDNGPLISVPIGYSKCTVEVPVPVGRLHNLTDTVYV